MGTESKEIIGSAYKDLKPLVKKYAEAELPVLFTGETGSGKEVFAQLYLRSTRPEKKKITFSCATVAPGTLMSEVFGHDVGAFTDAKKKRDGLLKSCDNGVLFLDELGDASPEFQAAVLRVVEGSSFNPVGSDTQITVNTLVIAATNRPGNIREDLKQRFHVLPVPPLQKFDIPPLARHFLKRPIKKSVLDEMTRREYLGNVRELEKYCYQLRTERGEAIFSDRDTQFVPERPPFDYDRYRRELEVWGRHVEPLLKKHRLSFKYSYFPSWDDSLDASTVATVLGRRTPPLTYGQGEELSRAIFEADVTKEMTRLPTWVPGLVTIIRLLNCGIEHTTDGTELLPWFTRRLTDLFETRSLPYLLWTIYRFDTDEAGAIVHPSLWYLFDLSHQEALRKFDLAYLEFNERQSESQADAARKVGMHPGTFRSRLTKLRGQK